MVFSLVFLNRRMLPQFPNVRLLGYYDMRPISKTPGLSKAFESFIFDYLFEDMKERRFPTIWI